MNKSKTLIELKKDALGQEVLAFFKGEKSFEIIERNDGYINFSAGASEYFSEFNDWSEIQKQSIIYTHGRVLDVGAGAGRVSLYLQNKNFDVLAIDNSTLAIEVCKKRGVKQAKILPIEHIGKFKANSFDTIVMLGNNFGLFGNYKKAKNLLKKFYKITSKDALIIVETVDPYKAEDPIHLAYHEFNRQKGRMAGQLRIRVRFRNYATDWFDFLFVSKDEMIEILNNTGWKVKKFIVSDNDLYPVYSAIIEKE